MTPRLLRHEDAAAYLGIGVNLFDELVAPYVPLVPVTGSAKGRR